MTDNDVYYRYQPLKPNHIRILHINYPSKPTLEFMIELTIEEVDLHAKPIFNALSYTWGPPNLFIEEEQVFTKEPRCYPFICNGKLVRGTENLRDALWKIRSAKLGHSSKLIQDQFQIDVTLPIWIDALCINQDDVEERNAQVTIMANIYRSAQTVLAWLGEQDEYSRVALPMLEPIGRLSETRPVGDHVRSTPIEYARQMNYVESLYKRDQWIALCLFLKRRWFYRTWILQEVSLNPTVILMCGTVCVTWSTIAATARYLVFSDMPHILTEMVHFYASQHPQLRDLLSTNAFLSSGLTDFSRISFTHGIGGKVRDGKFVSAYYSTQLALNTDCTDPRDKIYALLGLSSDLNQGPLQIRPDYNSDIPTVYIQAWSTIIRQQGDLNLLHTFQNPLKFQRMAGLPSWCPDLMQGLGQANFYIPGDPVRWQADKGLFSGERSILTVDKVLKANGLCMSRIAETLTVNMRQLESPFLCKDLISLVLDLPDSARIYDERLQSKFETLWRTLIAGSLDGPRKADAEIGLSVVKNLSSCLNVIRRTQSSTRVTISKSELLQAQNLFEQLTSTDEPNSHTPDLCKLESYLKANPAVKETTEAFELKRSESMYTDLKNLFDVTAQDESNIIAWHTKAKKTFGGRYIFRAENGRLGMCSDCARTGDEVWLLDGLDAPCILRALPNGSYQFLGPAYVHGIMFGEGVPQDPQTTMINIE